MGDKRTVNYGDKQSFDKDEKSEFEEVADDDLDDVQLPQRWWHWSTRLRGRYNLRRHTVRQVERHLIDKLPNLFSAGRFLTIWVLLISLVAVVLLFQIRALTPYYTELKAVEGGVYVEGLVGRATNFNPIYATTTVDRSVARLVFANLFDYDQHNRLQPVLAESLSSDEKSQQYTVKLRAGLKWHDGQDLTAEDVIFTVKTIQDADARSPLRDDWQGVSVAQIDDHTLRFTLEASFSPFEANLVLPILPRHLLKNVAPKQLRSNAFNFQPVGSGPFIFERLQPLSSGGIDEKELRIQLRRNQNWPPASTEQGVLLEALHFWVVPTPQRLTDLFNQGQISGAFGLIADQVSLDNGEYRVANLRLMNGVYLFFKNSSPFLSELKMRQALVAALDIRELLAQFDENHQRIFGPLLPEHLGYNLVDRPPPHNAATTKRLLTELGWQEQSQGWFKDDRKLSFILTTQKDTPYEVLAQAIRQQLALLKIEVALDLRSPETVPFEILRKHNYGDMLIYGLNLGGDADVYSYWHSSQIDVHSVLRLNLSEYQSLEADEALEVARSRHQPDIRQKRYADFQRIWMADLPALALYRFQLKYYTLGDVDGPRPGLLLIKASDRFLDVESWAVVKERHTFER